MITTVAFLFLFSQTVLAIPAQPNQFHGTATINGREAPDGAEVSAVIDGEIVKTVTVEDGYYNLIVEDPNDDRSGKEVSFLIEDESTDQNETFKNGGVDNIDLTVSIDNYWETDDTGATGGTTGRTAGSDEEDRTVVDTEIDEEEGDEESEEETVSEEESQEEEICRERWTCTEWSECEDGFQTRNCTDENNCGTEIYKPQETKPCSEPTEQGLTGLFFTTQGALVLGIIAFLGAGIAMTFFFKK